MPAMQTFPGSIPCISIEKFSSGSCCHPEKTLAKCQFLFLFLNAFLQFTVFFFPAKETLAQTGLLVWPSRGAYVFAFLLSALVSTSPPPLGLIMAGLKTASGEYIDDSWELSVFVDELGAQAEPVKLRVTGSLHIGGIMLQIVDKLSKSCPGGTSVWFSSKPCLDVPCSIPDNSSERF